jgi:uncharacterized membrane protein YbhN (UPF0104 family)
MADELSPRHVLRRLLELAGILLAVALLVLLGPGLGSLRSYIARGSPSFMAAGVALEVLSAISYVIIFRAVFCPRLNWRLSYQIGMAEQGANSVLSVSGTGGLALGAWALRRGGMSTEHVGRRTVAFFLLTSLANVGGVILFALLFLSGILGDDRNPILTYGFGGAALVATVAVLALPLLLHPSPDQPLPGGRQGTVAVAARFARDSVGLGVRDAVELLRRRSTGVLLGSLGTVAFDIAVLAVAFKGFGYSPPIGVLVMGYLIGQLGGNVPIPGGIGGLDAGLIGTFALFHQPLAVTSAAVLIYHAIVIWVPGLLGSVAFVQLRRTLAREAQPAATCTPLPNAADTTPLPALAG